MQQNAPKGNTKTLAQDFESFFELLNSMVDETCRVIFCQFRGDPNADDPTKWRAHVLNYPEAVDEKANVYLCVSAMKAGDDGKFRRKKANFAGGLLLMIDDLGTGPGSKFPLSLLDAAPPTALIETSPDNFQAVYVFEQRVTDADEFNSLIKAFIAQKFLDGKDPGMAGINRVFRPPVGINGKPKYGGNFTVRLREWHPERRFTVASLCEAFGLKLEPPGVRRRRIPPEGVEESVAAFKATLAELRECGMVKRDDPSADLWLSIVCPWVAEHTGSADNGAALRLPHDDNGYNGGFKCHHGACAEKGWRDVTDWLADEHEHVLDSINAAAEPDLPQPTIQE